MPNRCILYSDANCFYASVEVLLNSELRGKAVAVCGSTEDRHGIVLARSEKAKKAGVKTGQANWEARQTCPGLIVVPPHYDQYCKFSRLPRNIYLRYTDLVESYGMDISKSARKTESQNWARRWRSICSSMMTNGRRRSTPAPATVNRRPSCLTWRWIWSSKIPR